MKTCRIILGAGALGALLAGAPAALAQSRGVVIGAIDDMSGLYADVIGQGGVEAAKMAIADFGGEVLGKTIEFISTDHQNKPDIGSAKFREFVDRNAVTMVIGGSNTGVSLAMAPVAKEKKTPFIAIGAAGASLTGKDCNAFTIHYAYDTTALGNGTASTILKQGGKSWFFLTADYAFGTQLQDAASRVVTANGGKVLGAVRVPLSTADFSSFLLQAQSSNAQVLGLANAGNDFSNSIKAAKEFGITQTMKPAALLAFISDIHALGLETAQGLTYTTTWYWDIDDKTRAFSKRFAATMKRPPGELQAAVYSAVTTYLNAVKAAGSVEGEAVMAVLHKAKVDDMFTTGGTIRADGLMEHPMYIVEVKKPAESKAPWDYLKVVQTLDGVSAFGPLSDSTCPLAK